MRGFGTVMLLTSFAKTALAGRTLGAGSAGRRTLAFAAGTAAKSAGILSRSRRSSLPRVLPLFKLATFGGPRRAPLAAAFSSAASEAPVVAPVPVEKFRKDYAPLPWSVAHVHLSFDLQAEGRSAASSPSPRPTTVTSTLELSASPHHPSDASVDLVLDCEDLDLLSVELNGHPVAYVLQDDTLTIPAATVRELVGLPGSETFQTFVLSTVSALDPAANLQLSGLYKSSGVFCTQCEAEGFRRITPYFDRPDVMTTFTVRLEADKAAYPILLSNGNKVEEGEASEEGRHFAVWEDPFKKPSYLFAVVAGDLGSIKDTFVTSSGRHVALEIFSEHSNVDQLGHAMRSVRKAMAWDEARFGLEYDLGVYNIVAVDDFNMGAMENKGLNVFNTALTLAKPSTATDADYDRIESVIGHEYFHNWSGNRVTCRDWFQLTLKEGLTVYRDQEFSADMGSRAVVRIDNVRSLRGRQFPEDGGPMAHPIRPESYVAMDNFYTATVYEKGAEVIRMYETILGGRAAFRAGLDLYFARHDGEAVTCDDFRAAMQDANPGSLLGPQFERWYTQPGTPEVVVTRSDGATEGTVTLTLRQSCRDAPPSGGSKASLPFHIPVVVGLLDALTGQELLPSQTLHLTQEEQSFTLQDPEGAGGGKLAAALSGGGSSFKVVPSLLRGFSAPVRLRVVPPLTDEDLAFLSEHDTDSFVRWEASQQLSLRVLLEEAQKEHNRAEKDAAETKTGAEEEDAAGLPWTLVTAFKGSLVQALAALLEGSTTAKSTAPVDTPVDLNLVAYALSLPSLSELLDAANPELEIVDPLALVAARKKVKRGLAERARHELEAVYAATAPDLSKPFRLEAREVGRRSLRSLCLDYLEAMKPVHGGESLTPLPDDDEWRDDAAAQFSGAECMTDKLAALTALAGRPPSDAARTGAMHAFYDDARGDALVLNKWFSAQAMHGDLATVEALVLHEDFSWTNPNRLRSVVSVFASGNLEAFHARDGKGYDFVGDAVLKVDKTNNQIAARLCGSFSLWRKYDGPRQELMKAQLVRIKNSIGVSKDVFEIASRSLA